MFIPTIDASPLEDTPANGDNGVQRSPDDDDFDLAGVAMAIPIITNHDSGDAIPTINHDADAVLDASPLEDAPANVDNDTFAAMPGLIAWQQKKVLNDEDDSSDEDDFDQEDDDHAATKIQVTAAAPAAGCIASAENDIMV